MPDISMCTDSNCPKRQDCYRYRAVPDEYSQSYADIKYNLGCDYFIKVRPGHHLQEKSDND